MKLEKYIVTELPHLPPDGLTGRRKIKTTVQEITPDNVSDVVEEALSIHAMNASEIRYLYQYYKGCQDIRFKQKLVRENINNQVTINRANEIVTFKSAYLLRESVQYSSYGGDEAVSDAINRLNAYMRMEDKESKDKEIVDWVHICGVGERLVTPDPEGEEDGAPFLVNTLSPEDAFVIYSASVGEKPMAGVILQLDEENNQYATVYTNRYKFEIHGDTVKTEINPIGSVPLVEYLNNEARMGAFEPVLSILNTINVLESNAVDSIQDFVNGFDVFQNCEIEDGEYSQLSVGGKAIMIHSTVDGTEAKVYRVASEINQTGVQTRIDDLTEAYLTICGMPNRNGGSSTSDTGAATIFRDGWQEAESRAKDTEKLFKRSERMFLKNVLRICEATEPLDLKLSDIKTNLPRTNQSNLQTKTQVLCELLNNAKVHPKLAFEAASLFYDNEDAYRISEQYYTEQREKEEANLLKELENARTEALYAGGQSDSEFEQQGDTQDSSV